MFSNFTKIIDKTKQCGNILLQGNTLFLIKIYIWYLLSLVNTDISTFLNPEFGFACTRCDSTLESLLKKLDGFKVTFYFTDGWGGYTRLLDPKKHIVSKKYTQRIERTNLNLRTRCKRLARKTICFSKSWIFTIKSLEPLLNVLPFNIPLLQNGGTTSGVNVC